MANLSSLKKGDLVVRYGKALKVLQVNKNTVELQPYYNLQASNNLTYTVQLQQTNQHYIRPLTTKKQITQLLKLIKTKSKQSNSVNYADLDSNLKTNLLKETLLAIKALWLEKRSQNGILPSGKLKLFRQAMLQASEEISISNKILPEKAKLLILSNLKYTRA
jgi:RNA polymerase-interacting CarD/CdnL/TRCF family regulator